MKQARAGRTTAGWGCTPDLPSRVHPVLLQEETRVLRGNLLCLGLHPRTTFFTFYETEFLFLESKGDPNEVLKKFIQQHRYVFSDIYNPRKNHSDKHMEEVS